MADIITKIHFHFPIRKSTIQKKLQRKKKPKKKDKSKQFANVNEKIQKTIKNYFNLKDIKCCYFYSIGSSIPFHQQKIKNIKKNTGYKILNRTGKIHKDLYNTIYNSTCQVIGNKS